MSSSVKIDVNKSFEKYQLDCLFKTNCLVLPTHKYYCAYTCMIETAGKAMVGVDM